MITVLNSNDIRTNNIKKIIYALRNSPPLTKKDLADMLNLSLPTVSSIAADLEEKGFIVGRGRTDSSVGRKPALIALNNDVCYSFGIHISTHSCEIALVNFGGEVITRKHTVTAFTGTEAYWEEISSEIDALVAENGIGPDKVCGVRIAVPYILYPVYWNRANLKAKPKNMIDLSDVPKLFRHETDLIPVAIAAGVPRYWYGKLNKNAVVIFLSNYIEGCVLEKNSYDGSIIAKSCQIGHISLNYRGRDCFCGKRGCFQEYCSTAIIIDKINGVDTAHDVIGRFPKKKAIHWEGFFQAIDGGNEEYAHMWDQYLDMLAYAVHNVRLLFNNDVIICGDISEYIAQYKAVLVKKIEKISLTKEDVDDYLHTSGLSRYDACIGAALSQIDTLVDNT